MIPEIKTRIQKALNDGATEGGCRSVDFIAGWLSNTLSGMKDEQHFVWFNVKCTGASERHINMTISIRWADDQVPVLYTFNTTKQMVYSEHGQTVVMDSSI